MQAPGDNSITVVDPHVQTYADNNLNEKNLATQYIYTTEGQLIPTTADQISTNMDLNSQHYNTVHVTEAQGMHIQQVDYQYQHQYPDGTVQQVVPVGSTDFVQNESTAYIIDQTTYMTSTTTQEVVETTEGSIYPGQVVPTGTAEPATYVFESTQAEQSYVTDQPVASETEFVSEYVTGDSNQQAMQEVTEASESKVDTVPESTTSVSENVEAVENVETTDSNVDKAVEEIASEQAVPNADDATENECGIDKTDENVELMEQVVEHVQHETSKESESQSDHQPEQEQTEELVLNFEQQVGDMEVVHEESAEVESSNLEEVSDNGDSSVQDNVVEEKYLTSKDNSEQKEKGESNEIETVVIEEKNTVKAEKTAGEVDISKSQSEIEPENCNSTTDDPLTLTPEDKQPDTPRPAPRPRGRKPKTDIPLHILGHDVNKPIDNIVNGKTPKPRLGVKVPYRNLTSQIVSKQEIEKEIVERGRKKQEEKKEEVMFARQLTSRLAKKIAPPGSQGSKSKSAQSKTPSQKDKKPEEEVEIVMIEEIQHTVSDNDKNYQEREKSAIDNDSDLLAILEGDGEPEEIPLLPKDESATKESTPTDETNIKNLEREIALQQLHELPYLSPSTRFVKGKTAKPFLKELPSEVKPTSKAPSGLKELPSEVKPTSKAPSGKVSTNVGKPSLTKEKSPIKTSPVKTSLLKQSPDKKTMEVEPQIKVNMALKTYSRKRKSTDSVELAAASPTKKIPVVSSTTEIDLKPNVQASASGNVYMTKSSRVIKKKVIWDPDEMIPSRFTPAKAASAKTEASAIPKPVAKPVQSKNEPRSADLPKKSAVENKVKAEKKAEEKPTPKKVAAASAAEKRPSPAASKTPVKPKKPKSEIDRLLGDEGAIKMLYDLKSAEPGDERRKKTQIISVERTFKELAKKANQIKSDLVNTSTVESPKSLRKKEPAISPVSVPMAKPTPPSSVSVPVVPSAISRQKSKDSSRSTPPPSPAFSFPNETSYLIRRRSSSSISSGGDTAGSAEFDDIEDTTSDSSDSDDTKNKDRSPRKKAAPLTDPLKIKKSKKKSDTYESEKSRKRVENRIGQYESFSFKKVNKTITIDLNKDESQGCYFTSELLEELTTALNKISKEKDCSVVLVRSTQSDIFSHGLDYKELITDKENERKDRATDLAQKVGNFIRCLLNFPKVLVAGIEGECAGLAVTMLPLFDIVIGSDNATFSTSYSTLGCVAEAGFLLTVPHVTSHGLAGELLYASQSLTADEAFRRGLISKLCWPEKYQDTVKATLTSIAKGSKQSLEATKKQLRSTIKESTVEAIDLMSKQLVDHWTSNECQSNFSKI